MDLELGRSAFIPNNPPQPSYAELLKGFNELKAEYAQVHEAFTYIKSQMQLLITKQCECLAMMKDEDETSEEGDEWKNGGNQEKE
jgi:hypothetical protein